MRIFSLILAFRHRFWSGIATKAARENAIIGSRTRFGAGAEIFNIHGDRSRVKIGADCHVDGHLQIFAHEGNIQIGDFCFVGAGSTIWSSDPVGIKIGKGVLVSSGVAIYDVEACLQDTGHEGHINEILSDMRRKGAGTQLGLLKRILFNDGII